VAQKAQVNTYNSLLREGQKLDGEKKGSLPKMSIQRKNPFWSCRQQIRGKKFSGSRHIYRRGKHIAKGCGDNLESNLRTSIKKERHALAHLGGML